ncbi:unnamed protein product, partial [Meganyctiphanes norvegica]
MVDLKEGLVFILIIHLCHPISGTKYIDLEDDLEDELQLCCGVKGKVKVKSGLTAQLSAQCCFPMIVLGLIKSCACVSSNHHILFCGSIKIAFSLFWLRGRAAKNRPGRGGGYAFATMSDILHSTSQSSEAPPRRREAWFKMPRTQQTEPTGRCLTFQYAMDGLSVEQLEVFLMSYLEEEEEVDNNTLVVTEEPKYEVTNLWIDHDSTAGEWKQASLTFTAMSDHSIIFKTLPSMKYASMKYTGYAAVDDITFTEGPCEGECMFDADFCSWNNTESDDDFDWQLGRSSDQRGTGPSRDQASAMNDNIITGGYAYIPSGYPRRPGDSARLQSKEMQPGGQPVCLSFWINLHGGGIGDLRVLKIEDDNTSTSTVIWEQKGSDTGSDYWHPCQLTVSSDSSYHVVFEAIVGIPGAGDIALDTVTFTNKPCPSLPSSASSSWGDCTFQQDTCGWSTYNPKDAMLSRVPGGTYDPAGHTKNTWRVDQYMKWDISNYQYKSLEKSLLISPEITESESPICLSFWVYMYSTVATVTKLGALAVVLQYQTRNVTIWRLQNHQHSGWTYAQVELDTKDSPRVAFEGIKGPTVIGKILLDDIAIFSSTCTTSPLEASVETGDCTFDNAEICGWLIDFTNSADTTDIIKNWRFADKGYYISVVEDNTFATKEGGYMLIESLNDDLRSILLSPNLAANSSLCMTFWYTAYYPDSGAKLELYRRGSSGDQVLWSITHDNLPSVPANNNNIVDWYFGQVMLPSQDIDFKVFFQAVVRNSGWALDDVRIIRDTDSCLSKVQLRSPTSSAG